MYCLGVLMVFGTLYYIVAIQMNRSSSDKQETQHESLNRSKIAIQNGDFVHDPEISKEALPDETKMGSVVTKVAGTAEVAVEDISPNVVSPTRTTPEEKCRGTCTDLPPVFLPVLLLTAHVSITLVQFRLT